MVAVVVVVCVLAVGLGTAARHLVDRLDDVASPRTVSTAERLDGLRCISAYPAQRPWHRMWREWEPEVLATDLDRTKGLGANCVRVIVPTLVFGFPTPSVDYERRLAWLVEQAGRRELSVQLTLFDQFRRYTELAGSRAWVQTLLAPYRADPRIAFVEVRNEIDEDDPEALRWATAMLDEVRAATGALVTVSTAASAGVEGLERLAAGVAAGRPDFLSLHYYGQAGAALQVFARAQAAIAPLPLYIGEFGMSTAAKTAREHNLPSQAGADAYQDQYVRTILRTTARLGLPPPAIWTLNDFEPGAIPPGATAGSPEQYHYGVFRDDGSMKPVGRSLRLFYESGSVDPSFNEGFEQAVGDHPALWRLWRPQLADISRDDTVARTGRASVRFTRSAPSGGDVPGVYLTPMGGGATAGTVCEASAWSSGAGATGSSRVALAWFGQRGEFVGQLESGSLPAGTTGWTRLHVTATAPAEASFAQVFLKSSRNSGTVWFDDVQFTCLS